MTGDVRREYVDARCVLLEGLRRAEPRVLRQVDLPESLASPGSSIR